MDLLKQTFESFNHNKMEGIDKTVETLSNAISRLEQLIHNNSNNSGGDVTESIFSGKSCIIPMADVQHIERHWYGDADRTRDNYKGILVITNHTKWNQERDAWENNIYLCRDEADAFLRAWCTYRYELEKTTLLQTQYLMKTQVNIPNHQVDLFLDMCQQTCTQFEKIEEREVDTRFEIIDTTASICFMLGTSFGVRIGHRISTEAFK